jgi:hypothetical protein
MATDSHLVQQALVTRMHIEAQRRQAEPPPLPADGAGVVPGDELVASAGKLSLLADAATQVVLGQSLWPRVRAVLGLDVPAALCQGSYGPLCFQALALANESLQEPVQFRGAARSGAPATRSSVPAPGRHPAGIRGRHRSPLLFPGHRVGHSAPGAPSPDAPPSAADASPSPVSWEDECVTLFLNRLEAGFFLEGLGVLWPESGPAAARALWEKGQLKRLDEVLVDRAAAFACLGPVFRSWLAETPVPLSPTWHASILALVREPSTATSFTPSIVSRDDGTDSRYALAMMLLDDLLDLHLGAQHHAGWSVTPTVTPGLLRVDAANGAAVGIWLTQADDDTLEVADVILNELDLMCRASTIGLFDADEADGTDEPSIWMLKFGGHLKPRSLSIATATTQALRQFPADAFLGGHDESLEMLARAVGGGLGHNVG